MESSARESSASNVKWTSHAESTFSPSRSQLRILPRQAHLRGLAFCCRLGLARLAPCRIDHQNLAKSGTYMALRPQFVHPVACSRGLPIVQRPRSHIWRLHNTGALAPGAISIQPSARAWTANECHSAVTLLNFADVVSHR